MMRNDHALTLAVSLSLEAQHLTQVIADWTSHTRQEQK